MRKSVVETMALAALLFSAALASCQESAPPPSKTAEKITEVKGQPAKSKLEELLEKALRDNPDLRLAAAKVAEAEAELNRARLQVVHQVAAAYQAVEAQKAAVESAALELAEVKSAYSTGAAPTAKVRAAERNLIDAKAKLADLESQVPYLLGQQPAGADQKFRFLLLKDAQQPFVLLKDAQQPFVLLKDAQQPFAVGDLDRRPLTWVEVDAAAALSKSSIQGPTAERIRAALDKHFTLDCKKKSFPYIVHEMNKAFQEASRGLLIKNNGSDDEGDDGLGELTVHFDAMPFGAALEWLEDAAPGRRVVVRDYGLVIAFGDDLPLDAPLLHDFWKGGKDEDKAGAKESKPKSSPEAVEGLVKEVVKDLVHVSIGSDAGVTKGQMLEVYRLGTDPKQSKYLGRVHVVEVTPTEAVAQGESGVVATIQVGDHVTIKIIDK